jgi:hypothetical protein
VARRNATIIFNFRAGPGIGVDVDQTLAQAANRTANLPASGPTAYDDLAGAINNHIPGEIMRYVILGKINGESIAKHDKRSAPAKTI